MLRPLTLSLLVAAALTSLPAVAQQVVSYTKSGAKVADVRDDLKTAIEAKGFVVDYESHIGAMLERTGKDVGSTKALYADARVLQFCSARLSRKMMEANPANIVNCPWGIAVYASAARPGDVVVSYKRMSAASGPAAAQDVLREVEALLDGLAREATGRK